jgi:2',3'-cyclic-nucleotide 2'-phosphodiesterase (5'-nucleotidase family)
MLDALNAMDFDAFVMGNHEFDWGLEEMKKYKDGDPSNGEAEFPFLGANIIEKSTGEMVDWLEPYTVVQLEQVKIGIIGIIGFVETSILTSNVEAYDFVDPTEIVSNYAAELRTEKGCDAVIVAAHADDPTFNATFASYEGDSRIDAIFNGHSHTPTDDEITRADGATICVLQNGGYGESFASLTLEFDANKKIVSSEGRLNNTNSFSDTGILSSVFAKYGDYISTGDEVILTIESSVDRYDVGLLVVSSMYEKYDVAYAFINMGGVRTGVEAGEVTYADLFQVLPFENEVYIITMRGDVLRSYLNNAGSVYYWGIYASEIVDSQNYQIAIVDYLFQSYYFDDYRTDTYIDTNDLIRDVFIDYVVSAN